MFVIEKTKDCYDILKVNYNNKNYYIGSKYNRKKDIEKFITSFGRITEEDIFIVIGISFGEHIRELLEVTCNKNKVFIIEPNKKWMEFLYKNNYINDLLKQENIFIYNDKKDIINFFDSKITVLNVGYLNIKTYVNYDSIYKEEINNIYSILREELIKKTTQRNTMLHFSDKWIEVFLENLKYITKSIPINDIANYYKNIPAIIVSAGPSLDKNIHNLKNIENAIVISGSRTLKSLKSVGAKVDFLVVVDPGDISYELGKGIIEEIEAPLVYCESTNNKVVSRHKGVKIISSENKLVKMLFNKELYNIVQGGSVAHASTALALELGCNPIIFVGQDLAYTNERGHSILSQRDIEKNNSKMYFREDDICVTDIYGKPVRTSLILDGFRKELEKIIIDNSEIVFINATEGGADIAGTIVQKLETTLSNIKNEKIEQIKFHKKYDKSENLKEELRKIKENIENVIEINSKILNLEDYTEIKELEYKRDKVIESVGMLGPIVLKINYEKFNEINIFLDEDKISREIKRIKRSKLISDNLNNKLFYIKEKIEEYINN